MFKIPKKVEYALLALKYIAENTEGSSLSTKIIAENSNIPYELTAKILQKLVHAEIIESQQGIKGGYRLLTEPENLDLGLVIKALGEEIVLTDCSFDGANKHDCHRFEDCCLKSPFGQLQLKINNLINNIYLTEIMR